MVDGDSADDLVQDTYLRALRALPAYRAEAAGRTWLLAIARRACADALRRRVRRRRLHRVAAASPPVLESPDAARYVGIELLVEALEPDRRQAFVLTQLVGCSYEEAAYVCGVPVGTIRSRVARARADLAAVLRAADTG
jgi:RNA polymerase sigma-70 factor (ECF subfamily)